MSRVRLYVDEDAAERIVVEGLRQAGYDVLTTLEAAARTSSDESQLNYAAGEGRAVYTLNVRDFSRLHSEFLASGRHHAGIIVIPRQRYGVAEKLRRLLTFLQNATAEGLEDQITFL
jgi:hypothetical protein